MSSTSLTFSKTIYTSKAQNYEKCALTSGPLGPPLRFKKQKKGYAERYLKFSSCVWSITYMY